jgi:hypothetical protein
MQRFRSTLPSALSPHLRLQGMDMTVSNTHGASQALPYSEDHRCLERHHPPASLLLTGTVVVMNVCATVLSLMACYAS